MPKRLTKRELPRWRRSVGHPKRRRRFKFFLLAVALLGGMGLWSFYKFKQLERLVERKFSSVQQRWNIPSRVFADTEYLYPGIDIERRGLIAKLERLGYRRMVAVRGPGDFVQAGDTLDIFLHDFAYPQEKFVGFPIRLELQGHAIHRILDVESGEELALARLEPEEMATIFDEKMEDRTLIALKDIPPHLLEAVILIEDERFFKHHGVDPIAILRAAVADLLAMKIVQGGSTLTQQLVKNFFLTAKKSFKRKINEFWMALILETKHPKGEILEAYLNEIYLGQRGPSSVTGAAEAAKHYFGKQVHQISVAEAALLAGMIRNPSEYSPFRSLEAAQGRRDFVLKRMLEKNLIGASAYEQAVREPIVTPKHKYKPVIAPYFIDFLKQQLADLYPDEVLETEGLRIFTTLDMRLQQAAREALSNGLADLESRFGQLLPEGYRDQLQGCIVVLSPQNGYVRAMVGGRDYGASQFNRCTQALRQPGSTFKPFVYLTALDPEKVDPPFTLGSLVDDTTFTIETPEGPWTPQNYTKEEHGLVPVRTALENSYNIATAQLALQTGLEKIIETAQQAGIESPLSPFPSLALGAFEVTPLELAQAYAVFPNQGVRAKALSIIHVLTPKGEVVEKKILQIKRVFDPVPIALVNNALEGVLLRGTAASARALGFEGVAAGKTGTTSEYRDAWFAGYTPNLLALVWVGIDDNTSIQMSGARAALPIWVSFMKKVAGDSREKWTLPSEIIQVKIDPQTGGKATRSCPQVITEYFLKGTEPKQDCPHKGGKLLPSVPDPDDAEEF